MGRHQFGPGGHQNYKVVVGHEGQRRTYSRKYNHNYAMISNGGDGLKILLERFYCQDQRLLESPVIYVKTLYSCNNLLFYELMKLV